MTALKYLKIRDNGPHYSGKYISVVFFVEKGVQKTRIKIYPKNFRPEWEFHRIGPRASRRKFGLETDEPADPVSKIRSERQQLSLKAFQKKK
jgi:hypothetical protein